MRSTTLREYKGTCTVLKHQKLIQSVVLICSTSNDVALLLELTAVNEDILLDNINIFKRNGFEFSIDQQGVQYV